jgi:hypothetical protein
VEQISPRELAAEVLGLMAVVNSYSAMSKKVKISM